MKDLKEVCLGELEGQKRAITFFDDWVKHQIYPKGGELFKAFSERIQKVIEEIFYLPKPILIVSHGIVFLRCKIF